MSLKRNADWPEKLWEFYVSRADMPFRWGANDCALFAADAVLAMTGVDLAEDFRGSYDSPFSAAKVMGGPAVLEELAESLAVRWELREIPVEFARRGDVVLIETETDALKNQGLAIVSLDGTDAWGAGLDGVACIPPGQFLRAWRI